MKYSTIPNTILQKQLDHVLDVCELFQKDLDKREPAPDMLLTAATILSDFCFIYIREDKPCIARAMPSFESVFKPEFTRRDVVIIAQPLKDDDIDKLNDEGALGDDNMIQKNTSVMINACLEIFTAYYNALENPENGCRMGEPNRQVPFAPVGLTYNKLFYDKYGSMLITGINSLLKLFSYDLWNPPMEYRVEILADMLYVNDLIGITTGWVTCWNKPVCIEP